MENVFLPQHNNISELVEGALVNDIYIISDITVLLSKTGKPYLRSTLRDNSGCINMFIWDYSTETIGSSDNGKLVAVIGKAAVYGNMLQLYAEQAEILSYQDFCDDPALSSVIPHAPVDTTINETYLKEQINSICDKDLYKITSHIVTRYYDLFLNIPASENKHHSYLNGLLMHTCSMLKLANTFSLVYGDIINRDLLISGVVLHDIGKLQEFRLADTGLVSECTPEGSTIGHSVLGALEVMTAAKEIDSNHIIADTLSHLILSHHCISGKDHVKEPMTFEAIALNHIDSIDASSGIFRDNLKQIPYGCVKYLPWIDKHIYHHPIDLLSVPRVTEQT